MEGEAATGLPLSKLEKKRGNSNLDKCRNMWEISIPLPEKTLVFQVAPLTKEI